MLSFRTLGVGNYREYRLPAFLKDMDGDAVLTWVFLYAACSSCSSVYFCRREHEAGVNDADGELSGIYICMALAASFSKKSC